MDKYVIRVFLACAACLGFTAPAQARIHLSWVAPQGSNVQVEPGETASFTVRLENPSSADTAISFVVSAGSANSLEQDYEFRSLTPSECFDPAYALGHGSMTIRGRVLAPRESTTCTFGVTRKSHSMADRTFRFDSVCVIGPAGCTSGGFRLGSLPDLSLRISQVAPVYVGATQAVVRATVANPSAIAIRQPSFGQCSSNDVPDFRWDFDIQGGCSAGGGPTCFGSISVAVQLPDVPAHGEASCLIRLHFAPLTGPNRIGVYLSDSFVSVHDDRYLIDPAWLQNGTATFGVVPEARPVVQIPLSRATPLLLALILATGILKGFARRH